MAQRKRSFLITGTGARVGKTTVGCALGFAMRARGLRVGIMKPIDSLAVTLALSGGVSPQGGAGQAPKVVAGWDHDAQRIEAKGKELGFTPSVCPAALLAERNVQAVVIGAEGKHFCTGADLRAPQPATDA